MSLRDLEDHGVLLPEDEWGAHSLETTVPEVPLLVMFVVAVVALVVVFFGNGGAWTWIGLGTFLLALCGITSVCDRAVTRQRRRTEDERRRREDERR